MLEVFAAAAFVGAAAGLWNAYQFAKLSGCMDAAARAHNAHVNAPALHEAR